MRNNIIKKPRRICKKFNAVFLLVLACLCLASCNTSSDQPSSLPNPGLEDEEYEVMSAVIKNRYIDDDTELLVINIKTDDFIISDYEIETMAFHGSINNGKFLPNTYHTKKFTRRIEPDILKDFAEKNIHCFPLEYKFTINVRYLLVKRIYDNEDERESKREFWSNFEMVYPEASGFISFSRVGLNKDKTKALVYNSYFYGGMAAGGQFYYLEKIAGTWISKDKFWIWRS